MSNNNFDIPEDHIHKWGALESSHFSGTVHRKCQVEGCDFINGLDDDCICDDPSYLERDRNMCVLSHFGDEEDEN